MTTRIRSLGISGSIAALLAAGALLVSPAQPAQAYGSCQMLESQITLAAGNYGQFWYVWELWEHGIYMECW